MKIINDDCLNIMQNYKNNYFDLAIVDPPYGLPKNSTKPSNSILKDRIFFEMNKKGWDIKPSPEYFKELFRVSKNQIIFGGNYFNLPNYRCVIVWDKVQHFENFSHVDIAWTSFNKPSSIYKFNNKVRNKIHPTQKPTQLYSWILEKYAKPTDKILDTHLGSGSSYIAAYYFGIKEFVGIEIDKEYFNNAKKRIKKETMQIKLL